MPRSRTKIILNQQAHRQPFLWHGTSFEAQFEKSLFCHCFYASLPLDRAGRIRVESLAGFGVEYALLLYFLE